MVTMNGFAEPLAAEQLEKIKAFPTATLCDAMAALAIERAGCLAGSVSRLTGTGAVAGVAYTVQTEQGNTLPVQYAICHGRPGYMLVVATGDYEDGPYLGDINALTAQYSGLVGIVIDGYIRDVKEIENMGYPVFGKGCMPRKPSKANMGVINGPIQCAGIHIEPGDIIVGDDDGVVAIPRGRFNDVLALAAEKDEADERRKERIKAFFKDNPYNNQQHDPTTLLSQDIQKLLHK